MTTFLVTPRALADALADCLLAVAKDKTRRQLHAVSLQATAGDRHITLTASDGYILIQRQIETRSAVRGSAHSLIVPGEAMSLIANLLVVYRDDMRTWIKVRVDRTQIHADGLGLIFDLADTGPYDFTPTLTRGARASRKAGMLPVDLRLLAPLSKLSALKAKKPGRRGQILMHFDCPPKSDVPALIRVEVPNDPTTTVIVMAFRPDRSES